MYKHAVAHGLLTVPLLILLLALCAPIPVAQAHALLVRSSPAAGSALAMTPTTIELWFSEPLEDGFSYAYLVDTQGNEIGRNASTVDATDRLHLTLTPPPLAPGIYTVVYHTLSQSDGHEWLGSFPLTVLNPDGSRPTSTALDELAPDNSQGGALPPPIKVISRWFSLLGVMGLVGVLVFRQVVIGHALAPQETPTTSSTTGLLATFEQTIRIALILAIGALFIGGWLQVIAQMVSLGDGASQSGATLDLFFQTRAGSLIVARQLLVGALLLLTIVSTSLAAPMQAVLRWVALILSLALLATFAVGSHAAAVAGSGWAILGDFVHLLAAGVWLGGLGLLAAVLWQWRQQAATEAPLLQEMIWRFSAVATLAVFVLLGTGLFSTLIHLQSWALLWSTTYGWLLLLKLSLVLATLAIALRNHRLVRRSPPPPSTIEATIQATPVWLERHYALFARQVWRESVLGLGLMVVVAILVQTPIPQPAPAMPTSFFETILRADDLTIHLQISPNQVGDNRYLVHLYHDDGSSIGEVQLVRLNFVHQTAGLGQATLDLVGQGGDFFEATGAYQNQAGPWDISLYVRRRGLDDLLTTTTVDLPPAVATSVRDPWQNPIATLPATVVVVAALVALGLLPLLWRYTARHDQTIDTIRP